MKVNKEELMMRWETATGKETRERILTCIKQGGSFEGIVDKIDGLYDLRGITFAEYHYQESEKITFITTGFDNITFDDVDFSYADLGKCHFENCKFQKVLFLKTNFYNTTPKQCNYEDCKFIQCKFGCFCIGLHGGYFRKTVFDKCNWGGAILYWPDFVQCVIKNCNVQKVDFFDAHFKDVKFIGKVKNCIFRGKSLHSESTTDDQPDDRRFNPMYVDFSKAKLSLVNFHNQCDWRKIKLPEDGDHFLIKDLKRVIAYVEKMQQNVTDQDEKNFLDIFIMIFGPDKFNPALKEEIKIFYIEDLADLYQEYAKSDREYAENYCRKFIENVVKHTN